MRIDQSDIDYLRELPQQELETYLLAIKDKDVDAFDFLMIELIKRASADNTAAISSSPKQNLLQYCPHTPWPKQELVLDLKAREIFFGGAKGPGKTDLLLMAALRWVHVPGYAAIILRRDLERLKLPGAILDRAKEWWTGTDVVWQGYTAIFPSGAIIQFGYMNNPESRFRYQGGEYQLICWDELTEFPLTEGEANPYLYMFGMNRRVECTEHDVITDGCYMCGVAGELSKVPLQVITTSNPGGESHVWVRNRFVTEEAQAALKAGEYHDIYWSDDETAETGSRCFIPALIRDNPAIDADRYEKESLSHLPPVTRRRYMAGDWTIQEDAIIESEWMRYYYWRGDYLVFEGPDGDVVGRVHRNECRTYATVDTAGTTEQKAREKKGKPASWSVCCTWLYWPQLRFLVLLDMWRKRVAWNELKAGIVGNLRSNSISRVYIEGAHLGPALVPELKLEGFAAEMIGPMLEGQKASKKDSAKYERAVASGILTKYEYGEVWHPNPRKVPGVAKWLGVFESELLSWQGQEDETADIIDVCSYGGSVVKSTVGSWGGVIQQPAFGRI